MNKVPLVLLLILLMLVVNVSANQNEVPYGDILVDLPVELSKVLAIKDAPNKHGAMGRNKNQYIHVRFQLGLHNIVSYALASKDFKALDYFFRALTYSFDHQLESGNFELVIPEALTGNLKPSESDRVSGVAFFASSLGTAWLALDTSEWFQNDDNLSKFRKQLEILRPSLKPLLNYLKNNQKKLEYVDEKAPNRLLFDALAYFSLGYILNDDDAMTISKHFINKALDQTHETGYFIEADGYDSSYNGVAAALVYRLILMGADEPELTIVGAKALDWQLTRIDEQGRILTSGNSRVNPNAKGESFMGRKKDVDVAHTLELLMLAYLKTREKQYKNLASLIVKYYSSNQ